MSKALYSIEIEQSVLAILLQFPETYVEIPYVNSKDFSKQNSPVFAVIANIVENKGRPDEIIVAEKLKSLGITLEGLEVGDFCGALKIRPVDKKNLVSLAKELKLVTLKRTICNNAAKVQQEIMADGKDAPKTAKEMIDITDKYLGESLVSLTGDEPEPINLLEVLPDIIEEYGEEKINSNDLIMPYKSIQENLSGARAKSLMIYAARSGGNKSTFLLDIMRRMPDANPDKAKELKILYLDSEMFIEDAVLRYIAGKIGVPYWLIDSRKWRYDAVWSKKIRAELEIIRSQKNKNLYFESIGNKSGHEVDKYIKRFYLNKVGRGNPFLVMYDYLKITSADNTGNKQEYIAAYDKTQILKEAAEYCVCPVITAVQTNRAGIVDGKKAADLDDSGAVLSMSDRLNWLVSYMGILRKRTHDEMLADSTPDIKAPTHKLITTKTRYLGEKGPEFMDYVRVGKGRDVSYRPNFINLNISNFAVTDCGTYSEQLRKSGLSKIPLDDKGGVQPAF
jgi:replicative DNA helicase